jgi:hypothetical protein
MSEIYTLDNVILNKDLNNLYNSLINNPVWNLSRSSLNNVLGTFPGFVVKDNDSVLNPGWHGYFMALFENINCNFYKKYKFTLPEKIKRIHLGAKNDSSFTEFHCDTNNSNSYTIVGFLTPQWDLNWGGSLFIEDKKFEFEPGKFIIFKSNLRHNGVGLNKTIPFWRITLNLVVEE